MPINNFVIATARLPSHLLPRINRDNLSMSDTLFVINYWKLSQDGRLIFGGGENYSSRFPRDIKAFVRPHMLNIYPELQDIDIDYGWGGAVGITLNRMPDFGRIGKHLWYAQGFSGHGVPTATMAGSLLADAIDGDTAGFDLMASVPTQRFPGGTLLRWPGLVAGMLFYSLRDKLGAKLHQSPPRRGAGLSRNRRNERQPVSAMKQSVTNEISGAAPTTASPRDQHFVSGCCNQLQFSQ